MILQELVMSNWQPYYGSGLKGETKISLNGSNNEQNALIYGQNTHGKSAIWQAVQFAMFGRVNKRKTGWEDGKYKPLMSTNTGNEPLMNILAIDKNEHHAEVRIKYTHTIDGKECLFTLTRSIALKTGRKIATGPGDLEVNLIIRNETEGEFVTEKQEHLDSILPEQVAQFFMFDGERLNSYRELFEDTKSVALKQYIEDILQLPILTQGIADFKTIQKQVKKELDGIKKDQTKNKDLSDQISEFEDFISDGEEILSEHLEKAKGIEEQISEIEIWLKNNDDSKDQFDEISTLEGRLSTLEGSLLSAENDLNASLPEVWRNIISQKINDKLDEINEKLLEQKQSTEDIGKLRVTMNSYNEKLMEKKCTSCGQDLPKLSTKERDKILDEVAKIGEEIARLEVDSVTPDPYQLNTEQRELMKIISDKSLKNVIEQEQKYLGVEAQIVTTEGQLEKAKKNLSGSKFKEVKSKMNQLGRLEKEKVKWETRAETTQSEIDEFESNKERLTSKISDYVDSPESKKLSRLQKIIEQFISAWEDEQVPYRESKRAEVEKNATDTFKKISTIASDFRGITIDDKFSVDLIDLKGKPDAGSSGQSALIAYSVIDALTKSSALEFPFMIDTPSVSIDDDNLALLFNFLMDPKYNRQVIILPEGKEINPDDGDLKYGHSCAATYELERVKNGHSKINMRINNI